METTSSSLAAANQPMWSKWCLYGLLPLAVALAALWLFRHVFHCAPITTDENAYVFQAYNFLSGVIARPLPFPPSVFYHEMIIQDGTAGWLSRYPPGHPLWLLPGCWLNYPHAMVALAAGLSVWLMARTGALLGRGEAWAAALLLALSPFFLFTHGTLLSHTSGMLAALILLYGFMRWQLTDQLRFAALAGFGWSWLFLNRTYTALWLAVPFGIYTLIRLGQRRKEKICWQGTILFAASAAAGIAAILLYNKLSTGHARLMTYLLYDPSEGPGFGMKHLSGLAGIHTLSRGLGFLWDNLKLYDAWLFGFTGSLMVAITLALLGWRKAWTPLLLAGPLLVWGGYVAYFYPGPQETGPGYYLETLPFLILAIALGITRLWDWRCLYRRWSIGIAVLLITLCIAANFRFMLAQGKTLSAFNQKIGTILACIRNAPKDALLLATEENNPFADLHHGLCIYNPRGLDSQPLVVRSLGAGNTILCRLFPSRKPYLLNIANTGPELTPFSTPKTPFEQQIACQDVPSRTGTLEQRERLCRVAKAGRNTADFLAFGKDIALYPGHFAAEFDLDLTNAPATQPAVLLDITIHGGRRTLAACSVTNAVSGVISLPFILPQATEIEARVYYTGVGDVAFRSVRIREVAP